ncbi:type II toxin-antitoxin system VapC family toxin [Testudinibacter sp. TR-2022]|nr:type II toxin-antitoxin system VapC family toxin [Pasteurellaceae bacterium Phil31]TNH08400.1 type II toxin-antitoxin system VapC family toxin [Testudinibacter sp. TR-2022]TNH09169.1 type II toxin-antitoxin system VapC family toxin [Testudinibacter sp. TR-2022]TNH12880.1 type II toxin-antitoxin system VapC family toxin [Testudinibacter sp. TR-2022]TNH18088.1 type II toxin-antitoxin system VapC family toxin [Testudinibacter sp. TR-2022]
MLDTNIVSYFFRKNETVLAKLNAISLENLCISSITAAELIYGAEKRKNAKLSEMVALFLASMEIYDWNYVVAQRYGKLRAELEKSGNVMGNLDLMIAAHALSQNCILVTNDNAFQMIQNLNIENWTLMK